MNGNLKFFLIVIVAVLAGLFWMFSRPPAVVKNATLPPRQTTPPMSTSTPTPSAAAPAMGEDSLLPPSRPLHTIEKPKTIPTSSPQHHH